MGRLPVGHERLRRILIAAYATFAVLAVTLAVLYLKADRDDRLRRSGVRTAVLSRALEEHVLRTFGTVEEELRNTGLRLAETGAFDRPSTPQDVAYLRRQVHGSQVVRSIYAFTGSGVGLATSLGVDISKLRAQDYSVLRRTMNASDDRLVIGRVRPGTITGIPSIPVALPIREPSGRIAGIMGSRVLPGYFADFYRSLNLGMGASVGLLRSDGAVLARFPRSPNTPATVSGMESFSRHILGKRSGTLRLVSQVDRQQRLMSFRSVPQYGLIVAVSERLEMVLAPWREEAFAVGSAVAVGLSALLALLLFSLRQIHAHALAEQGLARSYALLDRIFATTHACIVYLDRDFNFVRVNRAYADACGHPIDFFPGKNHFDLYPHEENKAIFRRVVETGEPFTIKAKPFEFPDHPDWGVTYWDWTLHPLKHADDRVEGLLFVLLDVTGLKRANAELERRGAIDRMLASVARAANEAASLEKVFRTCLAVMREAGGFALAHMEAIRPLGGRFAQPLRSIWEPERSGRFGAFMRAWEGAADDRGQAVLVAAALAEKRAVWMPDLYSVQDVPQRSLALDHGLRAAFAFPVVVRAEVVALIEFFADAARNADTDLMAASETVAAELARLIDRRRSEQALAQLASIVESSDDAIVSRSLDGRILSWNAAAERLFGYKADEVLDRDVSMLIPAEEMTAWKELNAMATAWTGIRAHEAKRLTKDGRTIDVFIRPSPIRSHDGSLIGVSVLFEDITERRRSEALRRASAKRVRDLSRRLRDVEETERRAISRELHDRIGQSLTTLGLMLGSLDRQLTADMRGVIGDRVTSMQNLLKSTVARVRDLMGDLRPPMLDDYGLFAALRHLVSEFANRTGIPTTLNGTDLGSRPPATTETSLVRITQETLNNVAAHAGAKEVRVSLEEDAEKILVAVSDDGVGFDPEARPQGEPHWGIGLMRERAESAGVEFHIESAPGSGTRVVLVAKRESR